MENYDITTAQNEEVILWNWHRQRRRRKWSPHFWNMGTPKDAQFAFKV